MARGFADLRPAHGFAFARLAAGGATVTELAAHLGVTKQAASQLVDEVVRKGYAERRPHPGDVRARLIVLTERGRDCTRAAKEAAAEVVGGLGGAAGRGRSAGAARESGEDRAVRAGAARLVTVGQTAGRRRKFYVRAAFPGSYPAVT